MIFFACINNEIVQKITWYSIYLVLFSQAVWIFQHLWAQVCEKILYLQACEKILVFTSLWTQVLVIFIELSPNLIFPPKTEGTKLCFRQLLIKSIKSIYTKWNIWAKYHETCCSNHCIIIKLIHVGMHLLTVNSA